MLNGVSSVVLDDVWVVVVGQGVVWVVDDLFSILTKSVQETTWFISVKIK